MTIAVDLGCIATKQTNKKEEEHHYKDILHAMYNKAIKVPLYALGNTTTRIVRLWCIIGI